MSEFYQLRRNSITDMTAYLSFLAGFIGSAPYAWNFLRIGFENGTVTKGFAYTLGTIVGVATVCGVFGAGLGVLGGSLWEKYHRRRRRTHPPAKLEIVHGGKSPSPPGTRASPARGAGALAKRFRFGEARVERSAPIAYRTGAMAVDDFLELAERVWPREYDRGLWGSALEKTVNIGAWDGDRLVGSVRILTDGYFATVPEVLVEPAYQRRGIGRELMLRALAMSPRGMLFLGAQPTSVPFFERLGCERGPTGFVLRADAVERAVPT